jgi:ATP-dependent exoDNAse (exonuclease V) alpha subunit
LLALASSPAAGGGDEHDHAAHDDDGGDDDDDDDDDDDALDASHQQTTTTTDTTTTTTTEALDPSQHKAFNAALSGRNVFITGGPGTGKSFTTKRIIEALRAKHAQEQRREAKLAAAATRRDPADAADAGLLSSSSSQCTHETVMVTAPTGVAAILIEGQTLHSKPGPGQPTPTTEMFGNMWGNKEAWRRVRTLVVDEVSMLDAEFLEWFVLSLQYDD